MDIKLNFATSIKKAQSIMIIGKKIAGIIADSFFTAFPPFTNIQKFYHKLCEITIDKATVFIILKM